MSREGNRQQVQPLLAKSSPPTPRSNARRDEDVSIATDPRTRTGSEVSGVSKGRLTSDVEELDYEPLELHDVGAGDPVDVAVKSSKRSVLQVYLLLLKLLGWLPWQCCCERWLTEVCNVMYPLIVIGILITANLLQFASCLSRSRPFYGTAPGHVQTRTEVNCTDPDRHVNMCSNPISSYLLLDIMYALGYFYTLYIFRYNEEEIESVETLITNIFRLNTAGTNNKIRPPKKTLRAILIFGIIWVLLQCVTNILVIVARILDCHVTAKGRVGFSTWIAVGGELPITVMYVLTVLVVLGFIGMDMMFLAVSANYGAQCEMLIFLFRCFNEKIQARAIPLEEAKKEYHRIGKYIDSLGKRFAVAMSLMEVIFIAQAVVSFISLYDVKNSATNGTTEKLFFTVGMSYVFLWFVIAMFPLTQAARLNSACNTTVQVLLDVCVFHYRDASQSDINLFISYMTLHSKQTKARLFYLPIYIGHIFGLLAVAFTVFVPLSELDIIKFRLW